MFRSDRSLTTTSAEKPGSLSNNDCEDENESVTWRVNSRCFKLYRAYSIISRLIRQTLAIFFRVEFCSTVSKFRKRKRKWFSCVPVLDKTCIYALSRCSRATTAKKCTKKRDARAKLLFCLSKPIVFLPFSLPSPSSLLELFTISCHKLSSRLNLSFLLFGKMQSTR